MLHDSCFKRWNNVQVNVVLPAARTEFRKNYGARTYNEVPDSSTHCKSLAQLRDAEDCYHVILLYSSFLKYLPFHTCIILMHLIL